MIFQKPAPIPGKKYEDAQYLRFLRQAITPIEWMVLDSHWGKGYSFSAIGKSLDCNKSNAKKIHDRALEKMRKKHWKEMRRLGCPISKTQSSKQQNRQPNHRISPESEGVLCDRTAGEIRMGASTPISLRSACSFYLRLLLLYYNLKGVHQKIFRLMFFFLATHLPELTERESALFYKLLDLAKRDERQKARVKREKNRDLNKQLDAGVVEPESASIVVEVPSRTLQHYDWKYGEVLPLLIKKGYVKNVKNYSTAIGRCNTYAIARL